MAHKESSPLANLRRSAGRVLTGLAAGAAFGAAASALLRTRQTPRPEIRTAPAADSRPWEAATDLLRTGVCLVDDHNRVLYTNRAARDLGLVDDHEIISLTLRALLAQARRSGRYRDAEVEVPKQVMGEPSAVSVRITPMADGVSVAEFQDISELHRVERVRRDFVANISHELKTPVGAMQILAEALKDAAEDPDAAARFASRIQSESVRMNHLVSDLLELSRLQGAEKLPDPEPVEVDRIVAEAFDQTRIAAEEKGIELKYSGVRGAEVLGSEPQLVTAVKNLVGNAISYSPDDTSVEVATSIASPTRSPGGRADGVHRRARPRDRDSGRRAGPDLRAVLPCGRGALAFDRRHRARPGHRQARGGQPRRPRRSVQYARSWISVYLDVACSFPSVRRHGTGLG